MKCHAPFPRCLFPHIVTVGRRPLPAVQFHPPGLPAHLRCYAALPPPLAVLLCTPCPCAFPACAGRCSPRRTPCIGAPAACVLADARRPALLALAPSPLVLADARPATLLARADSPLVLALLASPLLPLPLSSEESSARPLDLNLPQRTKQSKYFRRYGATSSHCATVYRHVSMRGRANASPCCSHCATVYWHMYMRGRANAPPCCSWGSL